MKYLRSKDNYILRLEKGEELIQALTDFCEKEGISSGFLSGIGAFLSAELAFYNLENKKYEIKKLSETHEIASLTGNVALFENKPFIHVHCVLSNNKFECFGGHLKEGVVGATCEIYLTDFNEVVNRKLDEDIGLKLLDCGF